MLRSLDRRGSGTLTTPVSGCVDDHTTHQRKPPVLASDELHKERKWLWLLNIISLCGGKLAGEYICASCSRAPEWWNHVMVSNERQSRCWGTAGPFHWHIKWQDMWINSWALQTMFSFQQIVLTGSVIRQQPCVVCKTHIMNVHITRHVLQIHSEHIHHELDQSHSWG